MMQVFGAAAFSFAVVFISEMMPGFALESRADRAMFFMAAWLCGYHLLNKSKE